MLSAVVISERDFMKFGKIWRIVLLPLLMAVVLGFALLSSAGKSSSCMGVKILSEAEMSRFTSLVPQELSGWISCSGSTAAVDAGNFKIYISQNIGEETDYTQLTGSLAMNNSAYKMYFAPDEMFADLYTAVKENHSFALIVSAENGEYMQYEVVFTTLPVVNISGQLAYTSPDGEDVHKGSITVWDSNFAGTGGITVEKTAAEWYLDDYRDSSEDKTTWRVSLKADNGGSNMINLMGQGKDDDWIFNGISGDSTQLREKLAASLWNSMDDSLSGREHMAEGEYAEVVYNGRYMGVYLVQRRIDQKYLDLDSNDILLRDKKDRRGSYAQNNYTVRHGYYTEEEIWQIVQPLHSRQDCSVIDIGNWIDVNLFINAVCNKGRLDYTEMYYNWQGVNSGPEVAMIPVLSDSLWGVTFEDREYYFDENLKNSAVAYRDEYGQLKELYPDLDERIAERYRQLRSTVLSEEYIEKNIAYIQSRIENSGAPARDAQRWEYEKDKDTEKLCRYICERLAVMDGFYGII